jgi:hypothetical protein
MSDQKVPGLKGIVENEDGTFDLEIEDGMEEQFYSSFGLQVGDEEGLRSVIMQALENFMNQKQGVTHEG